MTLLLIIFISYSTANMIRMFSEKKELINHWVFLFIVIGDVVSHPIVVMLFILNKEKWKAIRNSFKKEEKFIPIDNILNLDESF